MLPCTLLQFVGCSMDDMADRYYTDVTVTILKQVDSQMPYFACGQSHATASMAFASIWECVWRRSM